jgi:hypothetical protein
VWLVDSRSYEPCSKSRYVDRRHVNLTLYGASGTKEEEHGTSDPFADDHADGVCIGGELHLVAVDFGVEISRL